jgi:hypothetical protein
MNANSNYLGSYSTPRRLQPIDPGAFYAVVSSVSGPPRLIPEAFTRPELARHEGSKLGLGPQRNSLRNRMDHDPAEGGIQ